MENVTDGCEKRAEEEERERFFYSGGNSLGEKDTRHNLLLEKRCDSPKIKLSTEQSNCGNRNAPAL